jgi:hypothetical protein
VLCRDCHHIEHAEERKQNWGRSAPGKLFPHRVAITLDGETFRLAQRLAEVKDDSGAPRGMAGVIRCGLRALAEEEGLE